MIKHTSHNKDITFMSFYKASKVELKFIKQNL